jgi:hypothetical protein
VSAIRDQALWHRLRTPSVALLLVTVALCLIRADDQPGLNVSFGGTTATIVPGDVALVALFVASVVALLRTKRYGQLRFLLGTGVVFCALVVLSAASNGSAPLVSAVKFVELAALGLGVLTFIRTRDDLEALVDVLLLFVFVADVIAVVQFIGAGGGRQNAFLGTHDFAALATLPLLYGLVLVFEGRRPVRAGIAIVLGAIGCILGAALASLLGFYVGAAAILAIGLVHRSLRLRPFIVGVAVVAVVSAGTLSIRAGQLGFLQQWFGKPPTRPGQYAASWSQRLIFTYIDGRVFMSHALLGTGWYPLLPPKDFDRYLPAARKRFSDQPANYFPVASKPLIPQQTFDQIPAELGIIGSIAFLALLTGAGRAAVTAARRSPLAAAWFGAALGAIAGEALFGGTPLTATFWLVVGFCGAAAVTPWVTS